MTQQILLLLLLLWYIGSTFVVALVISWTMGVKFDGWSRAILILLSVICGAAVFLSNFSKG